MVILQVSAGPAAVAVEELFVSMVTLCCCPQAQKQQQVAMEELQAQHKAEKMALVEELERKYQADTHNMMEEFRRQAQRALSSTPTQVGVCGSVCLFLTGTEFTLALSNRHVIPFDSVKQTYI